MLTQRHFDRAISVRFGFENQLKLLVPLRFTFMRELQLMASMFYVRRVMITNVQDTPRKMTR